MGVVVFRVFIKMFKLVEKKGLVKFIIWFCVVLMLKEVIVMWVDLFRRLFISLV